MSKRFGVLWRSWACALALVFLPGAARADSPVMEQFKIYQEALAAGQGARAIEAAAAALDASRAAFGDRERTAVLAYNLADAHLRFGDAAKAIEPAREALRIATTNPQSGLNPIGARLMLGRALVAAKDSAGAATLAAALDEAVANKAVEPFYVFPAAALRGKAAFEADRWREAADAWALAAATAEGAQGNADAARASALSWEAGSLVMGDRVTEAYERIVRSVALLRPLVRETEGPEASALEQSFGAVLAWSAAIRARMLSERRSQRAEEILARETGDAPTQRPALEGKAALCPIVLKQSPRVRYPDRERERFNIGGVAVRFGVGADGGVKNVRILASVAGASGAFSDAILKVMPQWRAEIAPGAPAGCRLESDSHITTFSFALR